MTLSTHHFRCAAMQFSDPKPCDCSEEAQRQRNLASLSVLLSYPQLGEMGMADLKDLLSALIPELEIGQ